MSKLTIGKQLRALEERLQALEAAPLVREAMIVAGLAPPAPPPKRVLLRSASSLWPTLPKAARPGGRSSRQKQESVT